MLNSCSGAIRRVEKYKGKKGQRRGEEWREGCGWGVTKKKKNRENPKLRHGAREQEKEE